MRSFAVQAANLIVERGLLFLGIGAGARGLVHFRLELLNLLVQRFSLRLRVVRFDLQRLDLAGQRLAPNLQFVQLAAASNHARRRSGRTQMQPTVTFQQLARLRYKSIMCRRHARRDHRVGQRRDHHRVAQQLHHRVLHRRVKPHEVQHEPNRLLAQRRPTAARAMCDAVQTQQLYAAALAQQRVDGFGFLMHVRQSVGHQILIRTRQSRLDHRCVLAVGLDELAQHAADARDVALLFRFQHATRPLAHAVHAFLHLDQRRDLPLQSRPRLARVAQRPRQLLFFFPELGKRTPHRIPLGFQCLQRAEGFFMAGRCFVALPLQPCQLAGDFLTADLKTNTIVMQAQPPDSQLMPFVQPLRHLPRQVRRTTSLAL